MVDVTMDTETLWQTYAATRAGTAREQLLLQYAPLVKYVVGRLTITLPSGTDYEDLLGYGLVGLIEAFDRFDTARGIKFESFAIPRIRGAVIDYLRSLGPVSRSAKRALQEIETAMAALQAELGRQPTEEELAERVGLDVSEVRQRLSEAATALLSLDAAQEGAEGEALALAEVIADPNSPNPEDVIEDAESVNALALAIDSLPERERLVVSLYYHDGLTMKEISRVLDVSESRVSQLHNQAIIRLRTWIRNEMRRTYAVA